MQIKINNQITEVKDTLLMRILIYCKFVISTTYWLFNVSVQATLKKNSVARESRKGSCSLTSLQPGWLCHRCQWAEIAVQRWHRVQKISGKCFEVYKFIFCISSKSTTMYSKIYYIFYLKSFLQNK